MGRPPEFLTSAFADEETTVEACLYDLSLVHKCPAFCESTPLQAAGIINVNIWRTGLERFDAKNPSITTVIHGFGGQCGRNPYTARLMGNNDDVDAIGPGATDS